LYADTGHTASERQIQRNRIFDGENDLTGFGQMAALLLTLAPVWSLVVALYKYPAIIGKKHKRLKKDIEKVFQRQRRSSEQDGPRQLHRDDPSGSGLLGPPIPPGLHSRSESASSAISDSGAPLLTVPIHHEPMQLGWEDELSSEEERDD
jgi:hypothetical protein